MPTNDALEQENNNQDEQEVIDSVENLKQTTYNKNSAVNTVKANIDINSANSNFTKTVTNPDGSVIQAKGQELLHGKVKLVLDLDEKMLENYYQLAEQYDQSKPNYYRTIKKSGKTMVWKYNHNLILQQLIYDVLANRTLDLNNTLYDRLVESTYRKISEQLNHMVGGYLESMDSKVAGLEKNVQYNKIVLDMLLVGLQTIFANRDHLSSQDLLQAVQNTVTMLVNNPFENGADQHNLYGGLKQINSYVNENFDNLRDADPTNANIQLAPKPNDAVNFQASLPQDGADVEEDYDEQANADDYDQDDEDDDRDEDNE